MLTFPDVSRTFPDACLETLTFPDPRFQPLKESGNVETLSGRMIFGLVSRTFPDGRPVQTRLHGEAAPRLERIVLLLGNVEP